MTTATKPARDYTQLRYVSQDGTVVSFSAPSQSDPSRTNTVSLDVQSGEIRCDCAYCAHHPETVGGCWLGRNVVTAWWAREYSLASTDELHKLAALLGGYVAPDAGQLRRRGLVAEELARRAIPARRRTG